MRRAFRLVIGCFPAAFGGRVFAVGAVTALMALGSAQTASSAESPRGLHVIRKGVDLVDRIVVAPDGTLWGNTLHGEAPGVAHVTADGRVFGYHVPGYGTGDAGVWADGALWEVDESINGLIRVAPDGRYTRFRDLWEERQPGYKGDTSGDVEHLIVGPDGRLWLGYQNRILSVAADNPARARVVATFGAHEEPDVLATGPDGSVWFDDLAFTGLQRVLPDGRIEAARYENSDIDSATVAPNGDVWLARSVSTGEDLIVKRAALVRIDRGGRVTEFPAPRIEPGEITAAADGTVWMLGYDDHENAVLTRMDGSGRFQRIFLAAAGPDGLDEARAGPDGRRLWLVYYLPPNDGNEPARLGWLPPNPCLSHRRITVHPHARRGDPIRRVRLSVEGRRPRTFHGPRRRIPIDLRGYLPGAVRVTLKIRTARGGRTRHLVFHTCRFHA